MLVVKVKDLAPGTKGHNLVVKVVETKMVAEHARPDGTLSRVAECSVGKIVYKISKNFSYQIALSGFLNGYSSPTPSSHSF